jgi:hypothetical protein
MPDLLLTRHTQQPKQLVTFIRVIFIPLASSTIGIEHPLGAGNLGGRHRLRVILSG